MPSGSGCISHIWLRFILIARGLDSKNIHLHAGVSVALLASEYVSGHEIYGSNFINSNYTIKKNISIPKLT